MPRIAIVNPITTESITVLLMASAQAVRGPATGISGHTAPRGVPYISSRAEGLVGGAVALEMIAGIESQSDAVIIAAFGDPGLMAARQLFDVPVIGMSEAAMLTACMLGRRFAIVTFSDALANWYDDCVEMHRMEGRLSGIFSSPTRIADIEKVQDVAADELVALCHRAVESGAEAVILGGASLAGLAPRVRDLVPVAIVDPIAAAVKQAEGLVALRPRKPLTGAFKRPQPKSSSGLPPSWMARSGSYLTRRMRMNGGPRGPTCRAMNRRAALGTSLTKEWLG